MIKKTLYFGNPAYLSLHNNQLVIKLPEVELNASLPECFKEKQILTKPIEDYASPINNLAKLNYFSERRFVNLMLRSSSWNFSKIKNLTVL